MTEMRKARDRNLPFDFGENLAVVLLIVKWHVLLTLNVKAIPIFQGNHVAMCTLQVNAKVDSHFQIIMITLGSSNTSTATGQKANLNMDVTLSKRVS